MFRTLENVSGEGRPPFPFLFEWFDLILLFIIYLHVCKLFFSSIRELVFRENFENREGCLQIIITFCRVLSKKRPFPFR